MKLRPIRLAVTLVAITLCVGITSQTPAAEVPTSPTEICPILIGSKVPSVTVRSLDGDALDLKDVVSTQPTILIFYRGGW